VQILNRPTEKASSMPPHQISLGCSPCVNARISTATYSRRPVSAANTPVLDIASNDVQLKHHLPRKDCLLVWISQIEPMRLIFCFFLALRL
jgi:hypothetical protein